jgi:hypothetical protein
MYESSKQCASSISPLPRRSRPARTPLHITRRKSAARTMARLTERALDNALGLSIGWLALHTTM